MIEFIRRFIIAWREAGLSWIYNPAIDNDGVWMPEDTVAAQQFFQSPTGLKFVAQVANYYVRSSMAANQSWTDPVRHLGIAYGQKLMMEFIENRVKDNGEAAVISFREAQRAKMGKLEVPREETADEDFALL